MAREPDSLDVVELVLEFETEFGASYPESPLAGDAFTAGEIYRRLIIARTGVEPPPMTAPPPGDPTWAWLAKVLAQLLDVPADQITFETRPFD
jgi:hypothetical protein